MPFGNKYRAFHLLGIVHLAVQVYEATLVLLDNINQKKNGRCQNKALLTCPCLFCSYNTCEPDSTLFRNAWKRNEEYLWNSGRLELQRVS